MIYQIEFTRIAYKGLEAIVSADRVRIGKKIDALSRNPRPKGCRKLEGEDGLYRVRIGDYRVVYLVEDARLVILVVHIGHRRDVYR